MHVCLHRVLHQAQESPAAVVCLQLTMCCCPDGPSVHRDPTSSLQDSINRLSRLHYPQQLPVYLELVALGVAAEQLHSAAAINLCRKAGVLQLLPGQVAWPLLLLPPARAPHLHPPRHLRQPQPVTAEAESATRCTPQGLCMATPDIMFEVVVCVLRQSGLQWWCSPSQEQSTRWGRAPHGRRPRTGAGRPPAGGGTPSHTPAPSSLLLRPPSEPAGQDPL